MEIVAVLLFAQGNLISELQLMRHRGVISNIWD